MSADIEQIKARALAARQFEVQCGQRDYRLQIPTQHELELAAARKAAGEAGLVEFFRQQLERAIVGWYHVRESDFTGEPALDDGESPAFVDYRPELVPWLLDAQPADAEQLRAALVEKLAERRARTEAAAKN
jgi:hypothetical protein